MLVASTRASEQRIRWQTSSWLISSEKTTVGNSLPDPDVGGDSQHERGLAHGWPCTDD